MLIQQVTYLALSGIAGFCAALVVLLRQPARVLISFAVIPACMAVLYLISGAGWSSFFLMLLQAMIIPGLGLTAIRAQSFPAQPPEDGVGRQCVISLERFVLIAALAGFLLISWQLFFSESVIGEEGGFQAAVTNSAVLLAIFLFATGLWGVARRRQLMLVLMSGMLMLLSAVFLLLPFDYPPEGLWGLSFTVCIFCELAVALLIIHVLVRHERTSDINRFRILRG